MLRFSPLHLPRKNIPTPNFLCGGKNGDEWQNGAKRKQESHECKPMVWGFTMIEMVVLIAMITMVSTIVLVSFSGLNEGIALNRAARELTLGIRKAQQIALAVRKLPSDTLIPPRAGIRLSTASGANTRYTLFADMDDLNADGIPDGNFTYHTPPDVTIEQLTFERNVIVSAFEREDGSTITPPGGIVNIIFSSPEARVDFSDTTGAKFTTTEPAIAIVLKSPGGKTKKVIVRSSGQVTIQ